MLINHILPCTIPHFTFLSLSQHLRRNAFLGCAKLQCSIDELIGTHGSASTVCTIGKVTVYPGGANVVPGECVFTLELRDSTTDTVHVLAGAVVKKLEDICQECGLTMTYRQMSDIPPVQCDSVIQNCIQQTCTDLNLKSRIMPSGAAHDAQNMPALGPMGMIFVASIDGVSHHHSEFTKSEDIVKGANVLLNTMYRLAKDE